MPPLRDPRRLAFNCRIHAERRALERHCPVPVARLEKLCLRMRPAFERPGCDRYRLTVVGGGWKRQIVWDRRLGCVVTVYPAMALK